MTIGITIPVYVTNSKLKNILTKTIKSINELQTKHKIITVGVINRSDYIDIPGWFDYVVHNRINNVASAWNQGIACATKQGAEVVLVMNQDVFLRHNAIDILLKEIEDGNLITGFADGNEIDYCCFMINPRIIKIVGNFDISFHPAYFEDNDYKYRCKLSDIKESIIRTFIYTHARSSTLNHDDKLRKENSTTFEKNRQYYLRKWGGMPRTEKYRKPWENEARKKV